MSLAGCVAAVALAALGLAVTAAPPTTPAGATHRHQQQTANFTEDPDKNYDLCRYTCTPYGTDDMCGCSCDSSHRCAMKNDHCKQHCTCMCDERPGTWKP